MFILCALLSLLRFVSAVCCEGFDICGQGQQTAFTLLTPWYVQLKWIVSLWDCGTFVVFFALVSAAEQCCDKCAHVKKGAPACVFFTVTSFLPCLYTARRACTAVMSVFVWEAVVHGVRCMLGRMGPRCCHDNHPLENCAAQGKSDFGVVLLFSKVSSFALHAGTVVTVGLNCCDHQRFYNEQSLLSPIRSES